MSETQIQVLSDLHLESPSAYDIYDVNPQAPYLALLGDIGYVRDAGFFQFLQKQLSNFRIVFLIFGNHEPYHSSWSEIKSKVQQFKADTDAAHRDGKSSGKLVVLDRTRYDLSPTVTVLGCTLFSRVADDQLETVDFGLSDFYNTGDWSVAAHQAAHRGDLAWLNEQVSSVARQEPQRRVVVFTHYCPSTREDVVDPRHAKSKISSGFMTDLSGEECWRAGVVKVWAFGHTHYNCDFRDPVSGKSVFSNQRGYYFSQSSGFDEQKVLQV